MGVKRQKGGDDRQGSLFADGIEAVRNDGNAALSRHGAGGEGGTEPAAREVSQATPALDPARALTACLMEEIGKRDNLNRAYARVKANRGAPGVDGMTVGELARWLKEHKETLIASLLDGTYRPQPVRGVEIPKPGGGVRQLGIPTVVDRLVQQAMLQVLDPLWDPTFSASSYGFRPGRSAPNALAAARQYVADGRVIVVDLDLEKFFDRVNHDILMARLARQIADKRLLRIVRRFLQAGMMSNGVRVAREERTPQGGPLSPLLANLLLDDLDKEREQRGHCFCRYADDGNIYVRSKAAGERVLASVTRFLQGKLKLRVNRQKSAVAFILERKFLGHRLLTGGGLGIAPVSLQRFEDRIRQITRRNRGVELTRMISEINSYLIGWVTYFRHASCRSRLRERDGWVRRKLRCVRLKQCKRVKTLADFLHRLGVPRWRAWTTALSGEGWWRRSSAPSVQEALTDAWFDRLGLCNLERQYVALQH